MKRFVALLADMEAAGYLTEDPDGGWCRYADVQAEIADANALLEPTRRIIATLRVLSRDKAELTAATVRRQIRDVLDAFALDEHLEKHLAGQPAAPRPECTCWDAGLMGAPCPTCREKPAAPTRTTAEQRVLDEMDRVSDEAVRLNAYSHPVYAAELARREGK